jgi:hypothetical protein
MAMTQSTIAVGVFSEYAQARQAIDELRRAGYSEDEIGFLTRASTTDEEPGNATAARAETGAVEGGVIGVTIGAIASLLIPGFGPAIAGGILLGTLGGAAIGAAAGSIIATLTGLGVTEREAQFYQRELEAGRTIVTVKAASGYDEALDILRRNGAYNATTQESVINATPPLRPYGGDTPPDTNAGELPPDVTTGGQMI